MNNKSKISMIISAVFTVLVIVLIVGALIQGKFSSCSEKYAKDNIPLVRSVLIENKKTSKTPGRPENTDKYIVLRYKKDGDTVSGLTKGLSPYKSWTEDDIKDIELVIIVRSSYETKTYNVSQNGTYGGRTTISSESVTIEFYNTLNGRTFETRKIKGRPLPEKTSSGRDLTVSDSQIKKVIDAVLKGEEPDEAETPAKERPDVPDWVPAIVSFVIFPGVVFLIIFLVKRAKRKKQ